MTLSARIAVFTASLLIVGVGLIELGHLVHFGHLTPFGLHADVVIRKDNYGIQGITKTYEAKLTNFGLMPARVTACEFVSDTLSLVTQVGSIVEKWDTSTSKWENIFKSESSPSTLPSCPHVITKRLWPGQSISGSEGAIAAYDAFAIGDRARFVVFVRKGVAFPTAAFSIDEHRIILNPKS